jgi:hypothetical protein
MSVGGNSRNLMAGIYHPIVTAAPNIRIESGHAPVDPTERLQRGMNVDRRRPRMIRLATFFAPRDRGNP